MKLGEVFLEFVHLDVHLDLFLEVVQNGKVTLHSFFPRRPILYFRASDEQSY